MDGTTLQQAGLSSAGVAILFILYRVCQAVIGHRLTSDCCGRRIEVGVAVSEMSGTSPPAPLQAIRIPNLPVEDVKQSAGGDSHPK